MGYLLKILNVFVLASIKYFWTPPYVKLLKLEFWETFLAVEAGGILGFIFYYYLSGIIIHKFLEHLPKLYCCTPITFQRRVDIWLDQFKERRRQRRKFTRRNKFIVRTRMKYGMWGIIILTPILLSIPLGAFLGKKYYERKRRFLPLMIFSIFLWGIISFILFYKFPSIFR